MNEINKVKENSKALKKTVCKLLLERSKEPNKMNRELIDLRVEHMHNCISTNDSIINFAKSQGYE